MARLIFERAVYRAASPGHQSGRAGLRPWLVDVARVRTGAAAGLLRPRWGATQDRVRRGLHGGRLATGTRHRSGRAADGVRGAADHPGTACRCSGCARSSTRRIPSEHDNSIDGSRAQHRAHYDLSNELFGTFLDPTMSYSSAWFDERESRRRQRPRTLEGAQLRKIDGVLDLGGSRRRHPVVGDRYRLGLARDPRRSARCARHVDHVVARADAARPIGSRPLACTNGWRFDYRTTARSQGYYDAIVSVEMIEAVGETTGRRTS